MFQHGRMFALALVTGAWLPAGAGCIDSHPGGDHEQADAPHGLVAADVHRPVEGTDTQSERSGYHLSGRYGYRIGCGERYPWSFANPPSNDPCDDDSDHQIRNASHDDWVDIPLVTTSFLAQRDDATAVIRLDAAEVGNDPQLAASAPVWLRLLIDGQPIASPSHVPLVHSRLPQGAAWEFTVDGLSSGIHTVTAQWHTEADPDYAPDGIDSIAVLRDATLLVRTDTNRTEVLASSTAADIDGTVIGVTEGVTTAWQPVLDPATAAPMSLTFNAEAGAVLRAGFSGVVRASSLGNLEIRALLDGSPAVFGQTSVKLANRFPVPYVIEPPPNKQIATFGKAARGWTFVSGPLTAGNHTLSFEMRARHGGAGPDQGGIHTVSLFERSISAAVGVPAAGAWQVAHAADATSVTPPQQGDLVDVPGLSLTVVLPDDHHQVAVHFDAEVENLWGILLELRVDGQPVPLTRRDLELSHLGSGGAVQASYLLKRLPAGPHTISLAWLGFPDAEAAQQVVHQRQLTLEYEPMHTPDLGRGPDIGTGSALNDGVAPIERTGMHPTATTRRVLPIIIDPQRPDTVPVQILSEADDSYDMAVNGISFSYTASGDTAEEIADGLIALINADPNQTFYAAAADPSLTGCAPSSGCLRQFWVSAKELGPGQLVVTVSDANLLRLGSKHSAPIITPEAVHEMLFNIAGPGMSHFWHMQSAGRVSAIPALYKHRGLAVWGPYAPEHTGLDAIETYWHTVYDRDCALSAGAPYAGGHQRRYVEGLKAAAADIDFTQFDTDRDGVLEQEELLLVLVTPQSTRNGFHRAWQPYCLLGSLPIDELTLDGLRLEGEAFVEWYSDGATQWLNRRYTPAHELGHVLGMGDHYMSVDLDDDDVADIGCQVNACVEHEPWDKSLMASGGGGTANFFNELDAVHKLSMGWLTPLTPLGSQLMALPDVKDSHQVLVLPRAGSQGREYFVVENRQAQGAYAGKYDVGLGDSGLVIWHVLEPDVPEYWQDAPADLGCFTNTATAATCGPMNDAKQCDTDLYPFDDTARPLTHRAIRLVRLSTTGASNGTNDSWSGAKATEIENVQINCGPGSLAWADGTRSPYRLTDISNAAPTMTFCLEVDGVPCP